MTRAMALLLTAFPLTTAVASDPLPAPRQGPASSIYSKPCKNLELQITFTDDGGQGIGALVRLNRKDDGQFERQVLTTPGYIHQKPRTLTTLEPVKEHQIQTWLQRLAALEAACRAETTKAEAFAAIASPELAKDKLLKFIKEHGSLPEGRVELDIHFTAMDGTAYHWREGLERHTGETDKLIREMSTPP